MAPSDGTLGPSRRRRPDLNIDTSPPTTSRHGKNKTNTNKSRDPVPLTPPSKSRPPPSLTKANKSASRALGASTSSTGGHVSDCVSDTLGQGHPPPTLNDAAIDMSNKENDAPNVPGRGSRPRDSHDLSLPARQVTRDSLMANMLMSLDQFSMGTAANGQESGSLPYGYEAEYDGLARAIARQDWRGGHGHSYSSDFDAADDSSRYSSQQSRGRRSNSSSNFQTNLGRINSMRDSMRSPPATPRNLHSRGGAKGSKSSSTNSIDVGYMPVSSSQGRRQTAGGRSSSFDYGNRAPINRPTTHQQSTYHADPPSSFLADDFDAAPTPTIPEGPRRLPPLSTSSPALPPPPPPEPETRSSNLERKRSSYSSKSAPASRRSESKHAAAREPIPPMPQKPSAADLDSAPAPNVGYEKTKEAMRSTSNPKQTQTPPQARERPGFFRRVFGSSKNQAPSKELDSGNQAAGAVASSSLADAGDSRLQSLANQANPQPNPPTRDASTSHSHHHVLQKKPSSFFRRRKKSVADEAPPVPAPETQPPLPVIAPQFQLSPGTEKLEAKPQPSPVSSLRKVMNPYLNGKGSLQSSPHPQQPTFAHANQTVAPTDDVQPYEAKRSFSPDYEPSPNARIRKVGPEALEDEHSQPDIDERAGTPSKSPPGVTRPGGARNNSFLNLEGSDGEGDDVGARNKTDERQLSPETSKEVLGESSSTAIAANHLNVQGHLEMPPVQHSDAGESDEEQRRTLVLPIEGTRSASILSESTGTEYKSAVATPTVQVEDSSKVVASLEASAEAHLDEPEFVIGEPTDDDRQKAQKIYDGNEDFISKEKAAAWMGEEGLIRQRTLRAYMELYDFTNKSIVQALRQICERLVFRAETQQVDRILVAFSTRWCDCNPSHGFKASDVIHTICYSIMLLNTDLHLADIEQKMTRSQFVKNTMTTIIQAVEEAAPNAFARQSILPENSGMLSAEECSAPAEERSNRFSFRPAPKRDVSADGSQVDEDEECGPLVKAPFHGTMRQWEIQVEMVLKEIYASIRDVRLPLFGAEPSKSLVSQSQSSLSVMGMLKRSPSVLSKAPSESQMSLRGRIADSSRAGASRFASKSRSRPRFGNNGFASSRTSLEDGNSIWSPAGSSATWSKHSLGRTQTSMSMDSFGAASRGGDYQQSIGFANALSQAIIRDDSSSVGPVPSVMSHEGSAPLLDDDSLELAGPPWVKEGMVTHKHHLDGVDKKAKDRNWTEVFAVVQKGQMSLFSFSSNKSLGRKNRVARNAAKNSTAPVLVGGGNWQDNATNLGTFSLRQTLASALPAPGYSRSRPHVWALSLPTGAVHLFQVGTPEIIKEFVNSANYWSARLSTHPLVGGISNMEFGWSDACINNALVNAIHETSGGPQPSTTTATGRPSRPSISSINNTQGASTGGGGGGTSGLGRTSMQSLRSFRSASIDIPSGSPFGGASRGAGKLPGDRIHIAEWSPPTQSLRPSNLSEPEQLETLLAYVRSIEDDLQEHNKLRSPMLLAFTPRGTNATKAMTNWERKSAYLLREIVKFRTYVDCLQHAERRRDEVYAERGLARRAARGELSDEEMDVDAEGEGEGDVTLRA